MIEPNLLDMERARDAAQSDDDLSAYIQREAYTVHHPVSTCRIGSDPDGAEKAADMMLARAPLPRATLPIA